MIVQLMKPSATEAELQESDDKEVVIQVKPRRWSARHNVLTVLPVKSLTNDGVVLDSKVLYVNQKNGKISMASASSEVEMECEADSITASDAKKGKKGGGTL